MKVLKSLVILLLAAALLAGCAASPSSVVHSGTPFKLLVLNCGSSSVKFRLYEMESETLLAKGAADRIGVDGHLRFEPQNGGAVLDEDRLFPTHEEAIAALLDLLTSPGYGVLESLSEIRAVGHRVVHGGESLKDSVRIDGEVLKTIRDCISLAPLHNPAALAGIEACRELLGEVPQVAVFDTAFHVTMPEKAYLYAIPYEYYEDYQVRRYGFHGISHRDAARRAAELLGKSPEELKLISCHLGGGSSVCAVLGGKSIDTTMGFTPASGLPMGTRSGDIDPAMIGYLAENCDLEVSEVTAVLQEESGLLGVSGLSSDYRDLEAAANSGDSRAALALEIYHYAVAKAIGAYAAAMNGVDGIIFTAGIGENSAAARKAICAYLTYLGVRLEPEQKDSYSGATRISARGSKVAVMVIPADEELVIARDTLAIVRELPAN